MGFDSVALFLFLIHTHTQSPGATWNYFPSELASSNRVRSRKYRIVHVRVHMAYNLSFIMKLNFFHFSSIATREMNEKKNRIETAPRKRCTLVLVYTHIRVREFPIRKISIRKQNKLVRGTWNTSIAFEQQFFPISLSSSFSRRSKFITQFNTEAHASRRRIVCVLTFTLWLKFSHWKIVFENNLQMKYYDIYKITATTNNNNNGNDDYVREWNVCDTNCEVTVNKFLICIVVLPPSASLSLQSTHNLFRIDIPGVTIHKSQQMRITTVDAPNAHSLFHCVQQCNFIMTLNHRYCAPCKMIKMNLFC